MYVKNIMNPGDFVCAIPVGVQLTLQYNRSGNLERVLKGIRDVTEDVTKTTMPVLLHENTVPAKINITNGTSWVRGVLYTNEVLFGSGKLPGAVDDDLLELYLKKPTQFNFFGLTVNSTAMSFKGIQPTRPWMSTNQFNLLPGWIVPLNMNRDVFTRWVQDKQVFPFNPAMITDYCVWSQGNPEFVSVVTKQFIVNRVTKYVDDYGFIKAKVQFKGEDAVLSFNYSDVVKFQIQPMSLLVIDHDGQILDCLPTDNKKRDERLPTLKCGYCGKSFESPLEGSVQCTDPHCQSKLLGPVLHFVHNMKMPVVEKITTLDGLKQNKISYLYDLFTVEGYKGAQIRTTLSRLLRSVVETRLVPNTDIFTLLSNACGNSIDTFKYYIQHPYSIATDLHIISPMLDRLVNWLQDEYNEATVLGLIETPEIVIEQTERAFEGAPIFRGKTIFLTGEFIRGDYQKISLILQSYNATVTTVFATNVDLVLVGGLHNGTDGKSVRIAESSGIPVMEETTFFGAYEIDQDMVGDLVSP